MNTTVSRTALVLFLAGALPLAAAAQWRAKQTRAVRTEQPIQIDGRLSEAAWETAGVLTGFIQLQPQRGQPESESTEVRILYDDSYLYVGFLCRDSRPEKIAARMTKRDGDVLSDDSVFVLIDTFHDRQRCYAFGTNLLGTQQDMRISDNGRTTDSNWDAIWKSAGARTEEGWSAEMAIDLNSLKYIPGENRTWGLSVGRGIPHRMELSLWTGPLEAIEKVSQFGELTGLNLKKAAKRAQIIPHIISRLEEGRRSEIDAGIDVRYAFSQQVSGNLTVNPDFATIEADQEQINLTRFELNLPEKRNFFLEGSDLYRQRISLFYSRRISDIYGGAKLYGKAGGYEFSMLSAQTRENLETGEESANFSVFRFKRDVMRSSNVGFLLANRLVNGRNTGTAGFDTALNFTDTFKFTGQLAASYGDRNTDNFAFFLRPSYDSATFHIHLRYTQLGRNFGDNANAVGFVRDDNRRELDSAVRKTFWLKKHGLERIEYSSNYNIYWGLDGLLRSWKIDEGLEFDLANKFALEVEHHQEYKLYEKEFRNHKTDLELGYNTREWQSAKLEYSFGRNYDLNFSLMEGSFNYKLTQDLSLQYALVRLIYDPDPDGENTWIHVLRATNYFTNDFFVKLFYQIHTAIDKHNLQVLMVYRFQPPFGSFQLAYQKGTAGFGERGAQGHTLFLKLAYLF